MFSSRLCCGLFCLTTLCISSVCWAQEEAAEPIVASTSSPELEKHFVLPWFEIFLQQAGANLGGRILQKDYAQTSPKTAWTNLKRSWVVDSDAFLTNQLGHPYQGALYFTAARSSNLGFWWSSFYTTMGSVTWEYFGENVPPSINDQFTTTIGGVLVGEMMHRIAQAALSRGNSWQRQVFATLINPMSTVNRHVFDIEHMTPVSPAVFGDIHLGYSYFRENESPTDASAPEDRSVNANLLNVGLEIQYGVPRFREEGRWIEPLENFHGYMDAGISPEEIFANIFVHGALAGYRYQAGPVRALAGFYNTFDFFSLEELRFGSVGAGFGGSAYMPFGAKNFVQFSAISSFVPVGASGAIVGDADERYNFGMGASQTLELKLGREDLGAITLSSRTIGLGLGEEGDGFMSRNAISMRTSVWERHGLGLDLISWISSVEDEQGRELDEQTGGLQAKLLYTYLWDTSFGYISDADIDD